MSSAPPESPATQREQDARYAFRGGALQLLGVIGQAFLALQAILVPRLFGQAAYGLYAGLRDIVEIQARAALLGTDKGLFRFVAGHRAAGEDGRAADALGVALRITAITASVLTAATVLGAPWVAWLYGKPALAGALPFMAPTILGLSLTIAALAGALGYKHPQAQLQVRGVVEPFLLVVSTAAVGLLLPKVTTLATVHGLAYLLVAVAALTRLPPGARVGLWERMRRARYSGFLRFSLPIAALELTNIVRHRVDGLIVFALFPSKTAALYFVSENIGRIAANIRYAFDGIAAPMVSEALHTQDRIRLLRSLRMLTRVVASLSLPLATTLITLRETLVLLSGMEFAAAAVLVPYHVAGHLANGTLGLAGHVLMMGGHTRWLLINQLVAAAINVGACVVLIPRYGLLGGAFAFVLGWTIALGSTLLEVAVVERVHPFDRSLLKPVVAATAMYFVQTQTLRLPWTRVAIAVAIVGGLLAYLVALLALRLEPEERRMLSEWWIKRRSRR